MAFSNDVDLDYLIQKYPDNDQRLLDAIHDLSVELDKLFICPKCFSVIRSQKNFDRHVRAHDAVFKCSRCHKVFSRGDALKRHQKTVCGPRDETDQDRISHANNSFRVNGDRQTDSSTSSIPCTSYQNGNRTKDTHRVQTGGDLRKSKHTTAGVDMHVTEDKQALGGVVSQHFIFPNDTDRYSLLTFMTNIRMQVMQHIKQRCSQMKHLKWFVNAQVIMQRMQEDGTTQESTPHFRSTTSTLLESSRLTQEDVDASFQMIYKHFDEYNNRGSGWTLKEIIRLEVNTVKYNPLRAKGYFQLPVGIQNRHAVINIKNRDEKCFLWCILASLHPVSQHPERVVNYLQYENQVNMDGINYPVSVNQIPRFEQQNDISVNVLGYEEDDDHFFPIYASKRKEATFKVDLLYLTAPNGETHYLLINNLNRLLASTRCVGNTYHFCRNCLQGFTSERVLKNHEKYCSTHGCQYTTFPTSGEDDILKFDDYRKQMRIGFCIYADMETFSKDVDPSHPNRNCSNNTDKVQFEACSYGYQVVCIDDAYTKPPKIYRGTDVIDNFLESLHQEEQYIQNVLSNVQEMQLTDDQKKQFSATKKCYICEQSLNARTGKVRDHCHITGQFRGAACNRCNLQFKQPKFIPVIFHNLKNFDMHLLMGGIGKWKDEDITCIPNSMERFLSVTLGHLRFIDSYQFLNESLATLVKNLSMPDGDKAASSNKKNLIPFRRLRSEFENEDQARLLLRKGVFCYNYLDSASKFQEKQLPSIEDFYDTLTETHCNQEDYRFAQKVWSEFKMKTFGDYHDLYLKTDVLLLADVFENFRDITMDIYGLDPAHFFGCPGLAWQSALKMTRCELQLLTDPTQYLFLEEGIRGGVSTIIKRWAVANNKDLGNDFEESLPSNYLFYVDCNNLYGHAMSMSLPCADFKWVDESELQAFDVTKVSDQGSKGYVIECDLEYDRKLHDAHSDYPLAPERRVIPDKMLSPYSEELWRALHECEQQELDDKTTSLHGRVKSEKLVPTLFDKDHYVVHYKTLKLYLQLGLKIKRIHKALEFTQSDFLKPYIDLNTRRRSQAKNEWEKNFYKLMNNAVFGKTLENLRKRCDVRIVHTSEKLERLVAKSQFKRFEIINEDLVVLELAKVKLHMNKPVGIGQAVLDLSKTTMYDFHYNYIRKKFGQDVELCFTDTDSFLYDIKSRDLYKEIDTDRHLFDFSNYPRTHFLHDDKNKKKLGKFKDEASGKIMKEFVGLRSKLYSYSVEDNEVCKAKGIVKSVIARDLRLELYRESLLANKTLRCNMNLIRSSKHQLSIQRCNKLALTAFDDKRYLLNDGIHTLAFGHYLL